jgi:RHS repeat-associated protein
VLPDGTVVSYDYDPMGRRIAKRVNGTIVEKYLWSGRIMLLAVYDGNDNLIMRFNYADDRVPYSMEYLGQTYYLMYDQIGSLRAVVDSDGLIVKRIDYDSFGNVILDTDPSFKVPIGFAGGLYDADTGLVRFGFRDYDPAIGRWTAKDPIDFAGGSVNLYEYVQSDPINLFDPLGLFGESNHGLVELGTYGPTSSEFMKERDVEPVLDVIFNNPVTEVLEAIPPGQSTGNPTLDRFLDIFQITRELWNRRKQCQ